MRILPLFFLGLLVLACNNPAKKKESTEDTAKVVKQLPAKPVSTDTIFTGFGTEPFWGVYVIADSKIVFHPADGPDVEVPFVAADSTSGKSIIYSSRANNDSIGLVIIKKNCSDGMSDIVHPFAVTLRVNGKKYNGCGNSIK